MTDDDDPYLNPLPIPRLDAAKWHGGQPAKRFVVEPGKQAVPVDPVIRCQMHRPHGHGATCGRVATIRVEVRSAGSLLGPDDQPACPECIAQLRRDCGDFITIVERPLDTPF